MWILFLSGEDGRQTFLQGTPVADGEAKPMSQCDYVAKNLDSAGALVYEFSASVDFCRVK